MESRKNRNYKDSDSDLTEEIHALQRSVALLQSYVVRIVSYLESQTEEKKKRRPYVEVGYRGEGGSY